MSANGSRGRTDVEYPPERRRWLVPAGVLGAFAFWLTIGLKPLLFGNIAWMQFGDAATYYLGWAFYRSEPLHFPPGASSYYGIELANAIYFTDSVPILAVPLKFFSFAFGPIFQYFGFWLLICFVLQGIAGWLLIGRYAESRVAKLGFVGICLFLPPFLGRIIENGHLPLAAHFWILLALYAYGNQALRFPTLAWALIVSGSAVTQPYLFAMVAGIWFADLARAALQRTPVLSLVKQTLTVPAATLAAMWLAGAFTVSAGLAVAEYGFYRANVLAPFDGRRWSYFWPTVPKTATEVAGTNFWGTGLVLICVVALFLLIRRKARVHWSRTYLPLAVVLAGMCLFALTNKISVGPYEFDLPLQGSLLRAANVFRASERFLWPVTYVVALLAVLAVGRGLRQWACRAVVAAAVVLQVIDTGAGWRAMRWRFDYNGSTWTTPLTSDFWKVAAAGKTRIRRVPPTNAPPQYDVIAYYALTNHLITDSVYQSRMDTDKLAALAAADNDAVVRGSYAPDTLYVLSSRMTGIAKAALKGGDAILSVDGFFVVAPGWFQCVPCKGVPVDVVAGRVP